MSNICDFDRILKTECNLQHFTRNSRNKNLGGFERDWGDSHLCSPGHLSVKEKGMAIMSWCLVMLLKGKKVNVVQFDKTSSQS